MEQANEYSMIILAIIGFLRMAFVWIMPIPKEVKEQLENSRFQLTPQKLKIKVSMMKTDLDTFKRFADLKTIFARYGFLNTPLTFEEFEKLEKAGLTKEEIYQFGCDLQASQQFGELLKIYIDDKKSQD